MHFLAPILGVPSCFLYVTHLYFPSIHRTHYGGLRTESRKHKNNQITVQNRKWRHQTPSIVDAMRQSGQGSSAPPPGYGCSAWAWRMEGSLQPARLLLHLSPALLPAATSTPRRHDGCPEMEGGGNCFLGEQP